MEAKERNIYEKSDAIQQVHRIWRRTRLAMPKTILRVGLDVIEAWFRGYRGSPGLGGLRAAGLYPLAELLDYEDTRLKTSSHARMGLYLTWKAS